VMNGAEHDAAEPLILEPFVFELYSDFCEPSMNKVY